MPDNWPEALPAGRVLSIVMHPDPVLKMRAEPVGDMPAEELAQLAADMLATMYHAEGRGLAAPQVGVLRRMFVTDVSWKTGEPNPAVLIDPQIVFRTEDTDWAEEQCLSIPDLPVAVERNVGIGLTWRDLAGQQQTRALTGVDARIAQHEIDHLDGRLIVDLLS